MSKFFTALLWATLLFLCPLYAAVDSPLSTSPSFQEITHAIRSNDLGRLKQLVRTPADANVSDNLQNTPLHYAAMYGSVDSVDFLLNAGATVDAGNSMGMTPLQLGAWDLRRTQALVEHGARVNPSKGEPPLTIACSTRDNTATVRYLVEKGAHIQTSSRTGSDALMTCASTGETDSVAFLLQKGADAHRVDDAGFTALQAATSIGDTERIRLLLAAGSDPNASNSFAGRVKNGPLALVKLSPLMTEVSFGPPDAVQLLLKAGARVNDVDIRKMSPLMLSIATDQANPEVVGQLIRAGADVNARDQNGDSVLDWAHKFQNPRIVLLLTGAGAKGQEPKPRPVPEATAQLSQPSEAIARALPLVTRSGPTFFREGGGCNGCHHAAAYTRISAPTASSAHAGPVGRENFLQSILAMRPRLAHAAAVLNGLGGDFDPPLAYLSAYADLKEPANEMTDMLVHYISARQDPSGAWVAFGIARPPLEDSTISRTAAAIQALELYGWPARQAEFSDRIVRGRNWLLQASPKTTYEAADRLLGLRLAGVPAAQLRTDAERLIALQRADGGWSQTPYLESDAYATGMVLDILCRTGFLMPRDTVYTRGTQFLLRTQFPDGSWYVRSRAPKFQPYFQSGFPFDHDQWISSAGTAWALAALGHAADETAIARR